MLFDIPVNLIREWCYCPRIVYYMELTNHKVTYPPWVQQGTDFHAAAENLWKRRNLSRFGLEQGKRHHNLAVSSEQLSMHGIVDMAIETEQQAYAAEFKLSATNKRRGDVMQLVAYAMLLEKHFAKPSPVGFLVGKGKVLHCIEIDDSKRREVKKIVQDITAMLAKGMKPHSNATTQCHICQYLNYCNDRF